MNAQPDRELTSGEADELAGIALQACAAAALVLRRMHGRVQSTDTKSSRTDLVTEADRAAEGAIRSVIRASRPDDAVIGEEGGQTAGTSGHTWVIDPLDGTTNYLRGSGPWAISVAVQRGRPTLIGAIVVPESDRRYLAVRGGGAFCNGTIIPRRSTVRPEDSLIATGFPYRPDPRARWARCVASIAGEIADLRRTGCAAYDLCSVADGSVDAFIEVDLSSWDVAAGLLIAAEAGCDTVSRGRRDSLDVMAAAPGLTTLLEPLLATWRDLVLGRAP